MANLKAQIRESFFNPILQAIPVLLFIFVDSISDGILYEWIAALGAAIILIIRISIIYKGLFKWFLFYLGMFLVLISIMSVLSFFITNSIIAPVIDEIVFLVSLILMLVFQKPITKISDKLVSPLIPMNNNIAEQNRNIRIFVAFISGYLILYFIFKIINNPNTELFVRILNYVFFGSFLLLILYNFIKTIFVRHQLAHEHWLPIITKEGKVVGIIQRLSSLSDKKKYTHPVVRGILVCEGRVLLQKSVDKNDPFYKPLWDNLVGAHISIGEKADDCLKKTALENFGIENMKLFYLTKYLHNTPYELQYELVFIICNYSGKLLPNPQKISELKWWTVPQIESNLNSGIFDERFVNEYNLLKRSGFLEADDCKCEELEEEQQA